MSNIYDGKFCVVWVDAHADLNTPDASNTKSLHGCPVSYLLGTTQCSSSGPFHWLNGIPCLSPTRIAYIGLRQLDAYEKNLLSANQICYYTMHEVEKYGISRVLEMALDRIDPHKDLPIHLSFDVDAVDPSFISCTGTPVSDGLTFREARYICQYLSETKRLRSMDLVELNGRLGHPIDVLKSFNYASKLLDATLGKTFLN